MVTDSTYTCELKSRAEFDKWLTFVKAVYATLDKYNYQADEPPKLPSKSRKAVAAAPPARKAPPKTASSAAKPMQAAMIKVPKGGKSLVTATEQTTKGMCSSSIPSLM